VDAISDIEEYGITHAMNSTGAEKCRNAVLEIVTSVWQQGLRMHLEQR
jgi:hypothetical protein